MAGSMDTGRIGEYIRQRGGRLVEKRWNPFGKGWLGVRHSRLYEVTYEDAQGNLHVAICKTNMWGVRLTKDRIIPKP